VLIDSHFKEASQEDFFFVSVRTIPNQVGSTGKEPHLKLSNITSSFTFLFGRFLILVGISNTELLPQGCLSVFPKTGHSD